MEPGRNALLESVYGCNHAKSVKISGKDQNDQQPYHIPALAKAAQTGPPRIGPQFLGGNSGDHAHVIMRASIDTIEAESTIHIAHFLLLEEPQLTAPLAGLLIARNAIFGPALGTDISRADFNFRGGMERAEEVELSHRANVFTKRSALKKGVYRKGNQEIGYNNPGSQPGAGP